MKNYEYDELEIRRSFVANNKERRKQEKILAKKQRRKARRKKALAFIFMVCVFSFIIVTAKDYLEPIKAILKGDDSSPMISLAGDRKDDFLTILVCVTDEDEIRTDSIVLIAYDKENQTVELLNIPRDTYCNATTNSKKVNSAYIGGIEKTMTTVSELVGFLPDKYIIANFDGLAQIIDVLGGVEVDVPFNMKYDDPTQDLHIDITKGVQLLDGKNSVHYLRFRKNNDGSGYAMGDLGRIEATQGFISTLKDQVFSTSTILKAPQIATKIFDNIKTDLKLSEIIWLSTNIAKGIELNSQTLPGEAKYISGISYYVPNGDKIITLVNEKYNPYKEEITSINLYK